jgi:LL-diaminopimelate aminotransferase
MDIQFAKRLEKIPPYLFAELNRKKNELIKKGVDIINMGVGDPDRCPPTPILQAMHAAIDDEHTHNYPPYNGTAEFRETAAAWMKRRFGVDVNPQTELIASVGSKEAIHNTFLAFVDPGDLTLLPDPGYPVYRTSTIFAGGEAFFMPLLPEKGFLPDLQAIPESVAQQAKLLWVNYPNNPTGAIASVDFFAELVNFCRHYNILLCHDHAYSEMAYDGYQPPSVLEVPHAREVAVEFHSLSKTYNMTGWRIGFVTGNATAIQGISQVKTNVDSGVFKAIQQAAATALATSPSPQLQHTLETYQQRRDILAEGLRSLGWQLTPPQATLYVWTPVPKGYTATEFSNMMLEKCGILVPPGSGYGNHGEGYFRISLTVPASRLTEAIQRMRDAGICYR